MAINKITIREEGHHKYSCHTQDLVINLAQGDLVLSQKRHSEEFLLCSCKKKRFQRNI